MPTACTGALSPGRMAWPATRLASRPASGHDAVVSALSFSASERAGMLLADLGCAAEVAGEGDHSALGWRRAGLMHVTGRPDGPGLVCPAPLTVAADAALLALSALAPGTD